MLPAKHSNSVVLKVWFPIPRAWVPQPRPSENELCGRGTQQSISAPPVDAVGGLQFENQSSGLQACFSILDMASSGSLGCFALNSY